MVGSGQGASTERGTASGPQSPRPHLLLLTPITRATQEKEMEERRTFYSINHNKGRITLAIVLLEVLLALTAGVGAPLVIAVLATAVISVAKAVLDDRRQRE